METVIQGIVLGLSIAAPIGPTNIEIIRRGFKEGWKSSIIFFFGVLIALIIYLGLVVLGLSFLTQSKMFNFIMSSFGVVILFYLSYNALKDFFNKNELNLFDNIAPGKNFFEGIVLTISNPVVLLFWTGIMSADLAASQSSIEKGFILSIGILIGVIVSGITLILLIHYGRKYISIKNFKFISLISSFILLYFALVFGHKLVMTFLSM